MASALNRSYPEIQGEFEQEDEFEDEAVATAEYELEDEFEAEDEDEDFLGAIGGIGKALGGLLGGGDGEYEADFEFEAEAETEDEAEEEYEDEAFVNPVRRIYPDAELMAHLSARAAQTAAEGEAEAFFGALVPLASKLVPRAAGVLARNAPALIRGTTVLGRPAPPQPGHPPVRTGDAGDPATDRAEPRGPGRVRAPDLAGDRDRDADADRLRDVPPGSGTHPRDAGREYLRPSLPPPLRRQYGCRRCRRRRCRRRRCGCRRTPGAPAATVTTASSATLATGGEGRCRT